ncbi:MAG TPA: nucleotidyltransferase domain-containing protein [Methylomirabilota bacterium]|nr:nucleotidyltransferase domain-containing protein [Methylomirabilota bacterium]
MNHGLSQKTLAAICGVLARYPQVETPTLYGSRAKGTYKPGSDIDLTLSGDEIDESALSRIDCELDDLLLPYKIDLSVLSSLRHPPLIEHIRRVGLVIYQKQHGLAGSEQLKKANGHLPQPARKAS